MNPPPLPRLAVCSWSLQPSSPEQLMEQLQTIGIKKIQCALDPLREKPTAWGHLASVCREAGVEIVSGMFGTIGEDYTTMESIRRTGGVVPDKTWPANWNNIQQIAKIAQQLNLKLVTFHAGFLPHDSKDSEFKKLLDRITLIADLFASKGIDLGFETGQETAETLKAFLQQLNRRHVGVNFDPANMILYDKGDPIQALRTLGPWLKQCHLKDAVPTSRPGHWGSEVVVGTGQVDWRNFFRTLEQLHFSGYCTIEREAGNERIRDIQAARKFLESF